MEGESDDDYIRRVYGDDGNKEKNGSLITRPSLVRRLSRKLSREVVRRRSSVVESLPETPAGWAVFASALASVALGYEIRLQKSLTCPPTVYGQCRDGPCKAIYDKLTETPESILRRPIKPSLFVGSRSVVSSTAAYLFGGPTHSQEYIRFREVLTMEFDGATVAIDWELPISPGSTKTPYERQSDVLHGPIDRPVILIVHGINNHANFGYIRSMARACTNRGWIAASLNMRGSGGVQFSTPRGYNAAYTGDIRCLVHKISARLEKKKLPIFIIGNSLSASLVTKYLGEEGLSGTLPDCVAGGAALGNPILMKSSNLDMMFSPILALGTKKMILQNWAQIRQMNDPFNRAAIRRALMAVTLAQFDEAIAPLMARNDPIYPFAFRIGFKNASAYWNDASSYRLVRFIPVPLLQLVAADDFLVYNSFKGKLAYSLANPNVVIVETKCGGHLGWQESPPEGGGYALGKSWADVATTDFIDAVFQTYDAKSPKKFDEVAYFSREEAQRQSASLRPRL